MIFALLFLAAALPLEELYSRGDYERIVALAPAVLADSSATRQDSITTLRYSAFASVALGRDAEARRSFRDLLALDPGHELDPRQVSPKIRAVFASVQNEQPVRLLPEPARVETLYLRRLVPWAVIVPGAAQIGQGRRSAGYALLGLGIASAGGLAVSAVGYSQARSEYLAATEPGEISSAWNVANSWYRTRTLFIAGTGVLWLYNLVDALREP